MEGIAEFGPAHPGCGPLGRISVKGGLESEDRPHMAPCPPGNGDRLADLFHTHRTGPIECLLVGNALPVKRESLLFHAGTKDRRKDKPQRGPFPAPAEAIHGIEVPPENGHPVTVTGEPPVETGKKGGQKTALPEKVQGGAGGTEENDLLYLFVEPRGRDAGDGRGQFADTLPGRRFYGEIMGRGKTNSPEHPDRVFGKPDLAVADRTDEPLSQVTETAAVIDDGKIGYAVRKGVDRKVPAEGILFRCTEKIVPDDHSVVILHITGKMLVALGLFNGRLIGRNGCPPECGNLENFIVKMEMGQPETAADEPAVREKTSDLARGGVCGNIKVFRRPPQKQIADTPSDQIGDKASRPEPVERPEGIRAHLLPRYAVFLPGNDKGNHSHHYIILDL